MKTQVDLTKSPLVVTYGDTVTDADVAMVNRILGEVLNKKEPFAFICDMTAGAPSVAQSEAIRAFVDARRDDFRRLVVLNVLVMTNRALRTVLGAIMLVVKPPYPTTFETTLQAAQTACTGAMAERRRASPPVLKSAAAAK